MFNFRWRKALKELMESRWERVQLDFTRGNGHILFQVFRNHAFEQSTAQFAPEGCSYIFVIHFHKAKIDNEVNFARFEQSDIFSRYEAANLDGEPMYFGRSYATTRRQLTREIREAIFKVYKMDMGDVFYFLRYG